MPGEPSRLSDLDNKSPSGPSRSALRCAEPILRIGRYGDLGGNSASEVMSCGAVTCLETVLFESLLFLSTPVWFVVAFSSLSFGDTAGSRIREEGFCGL